MAKWKGDVSQPLVSICCTTYNHEHYIEDALEGFLIQETDFPFEILINDDASTDRTADILHDYEAAYPTIIKIIYQNENQFSKGKRPMWDLIMPRTKGRYVALCEGDDYWTDRQKLSIQIRFLETNSDYVMSGHDAYIIDEYGNIISESKLPDDHKRDFCPKDLMVGNAWVLTMSWVFRNVLVDNEYIPEKLHVLNGDTFNTSILGQFGKCKYHAEIKPACYRKHLAGLWSMKPDNAKYEELANTYFWMYKYYKRVGQNHVADLIWKKFIATIFKRINTLYILRESIIRLLFLRKIKFILKSTLN